MNDTTSAHPDPASPDSPPRPSRAQGAILGVGALALVAAAVGGGYLWGTRSTDAAASGAETVAAVAGRARATGHNDADVAFAQEMTPHHTQALDMSSLAASRAGSAEVKQLAGTIEAAQQPEIDTMRGWLSDWGASTSSGETGAAMGTGMMSQDDMTSLEGLSGSAFDHAFLTMMISHHRGAVTMAEEELADGENADALALAASIQVTQQAQIDQMERLLAD